jgi:hypothetical protein
VERIRAWRLEAALAVCLSAGLPRAAAGPGDLFSYIPFATVAPQDIAHDSSDGTFWVTAFLDQTIFHLSSDLKELLGTIPSPFTGNSFTTGITFNPLAETLLVTDATSGRIIEIDRSGEPTGRVIRVPLVPVVNPNGFPTLRGLAFDRHGDGGMGSIYLVESLGTLIYEIALDGTLIRTLTHPDDPDGFPGKGASASATDIEVIHEGEELAGLYVTGLSGSRSRILRLDPDGSYTGISIPLDDAGGNVSGFLRRSYRPSPAAPEMDAFLCVVESNARLAVLEAGEPSFREIFAFSCREEGRSAILEWSSRQAYERIEILRGCEVVEVLPGEATRWERQIDLSGVYELSVRASDGETSYQTRPCTLVFGPGQIIDSIEVEARYPLDLTSDGEFLIVSDAFDRRLLFFDLDLRRAGVIQLDVPFVEETEVITAVARGDEVETVFIYNLSRHQIGKINYSGELLGAFDALLPNLQEDPQGQPDRGTVLGMAFDPGAEGGRGALLLIETRKDVIYQLDLTGKVIRSLPHPYRAIELPPPGSPFGSFSSGISLAANRPGEVYLSGGTLRELRQPRIFRMRLSSGEPAGGSEITTAAVRREASNGTLTLEHLDHAGEERLYVLSVLGRGSKLFRLEPEPAPVPAPILPSCRQVSYSDEVEISFTPAVPYETIEVFRDCRRIATLPGGASRYIDREVEPGFHEYAIRGTQGGRVSDFARCSLRAGIGALLQRQICWPARSPQQITRDPVDGSFHVAVNWPGDERKVYRFDHNFRYLETRATAVEAPWQIAALAVRAAARERLRYYITWLQPVPLGEVGSQRFLLLSETLQGEPREAVEIFPPRPTNGFITFPTGLAWDPGSDTFYFLERNSKTFVQMAPGGSILRTFPHPSPPFQNFVFNLGVTVTPEGSLLVTGSGRLDQRITKVLEIRSSGALTGFEIPIGEIANTITGITLAGRDLVAVGTAGYSDLLRLKAFSGTPAPFVRGDSDHNGRVELTDALITLNHLFQSGPRPLCEDGADADDDGYLTISDAILTLLRLFAGGRALPAPYPEPGQDPTADGLGCS